MSAPPPPHVRPPSTNARLHRHLVLPCQRQQAITCLMVPASSATRRTRAYTGSDRCGRSSHSDSNSANLASKDPPPRGQGTPRPTSAIAARPLRRSSNSHNSQSVDHISWASSSLFPRDCLLPRVGHA